MTHPLRLYGDGLVDARELGLGVNVCLEDGTILPLALERYLGAADETDEQILRSLRGPALDVGCGPGRHLHALARRGVFALGVDLSPIAVDLARGGGGHAIVASIFDELPGTGTWRSALLLDGNVGIGGAPERLLQRVGALLTDGGELLVELEAPPARTTETRARLRTPKATSGWFRWARVAAPDIETLGRRSGFDMTQRWMLQGRWFARLLKRPQARPQPTQRHVGTSAI